MLAPMSPPVSAPPPAHPTTSLHYGHYGPDGQGWPSSVSQPETSQSFPATGHGPAHQNGPAGAQEPGQTNGHAGHNGHTGPLPVVSSGTVYGAAPAADPRDETAQPTSGGYGSMPSALDRIAAPAAPVDPRVRVHGDNGQPPYGAYPDQTWGYQEEAHPANGASPDVYQEQYQPQGYQAQQYPSQEYPQQEYQQQEYPPPQQYPSQQQQYPQQQYQSYEQPYEQHPYQPQPPYGSEFDWAAPQQEQVPAPAVHPVPAPAVHPVPLPTQRMPEDDPLVGPLPPELHELATPLSAAEPMMPAFASEPPYAAQEPATARAETDLGLPQRVPSHPDVPQVPEVEVEPLVTEATPAGGAELARIATFLREEREDEDDEPSLDDRPDGFDIPAVLRAVQGVSGVREATLRKNADGLHTLRLELLDDADPGRVSRAVARLLNERMGLAAEPNPPASADLTPPASRSSVRGNAPHSALPGYGREARRRRPVSGVRRPAEAPRPTSDDYLQPELPQQHLSRPEPEAARPPAPVAEKPVLGPQPPTPVNRDAPPALVPQSTAIVSPRVIIDQVEVSTQGVDAVVEVRLIADGHPAVGVASGPAVDGYILRLSAAAAASAVDQLLVDVDATARARCYIEHAAVVQLGGCEVAVVVLLLLYDGWVEQLTGSSVNSGDPRQAVVRATLAAVNRRLEALLP
jgi:hypothetical protein